MRALILDGGNSRGALAGVRGLAAAGWRVGVGTPKRNSLAATSRWCARWHRVPAPEASLDAFLSATETAVLAERYELVLGAGDAEVLALSYGRDRIPTRVPYPAHEVVLRALDKLDVTVAAAAAGLRTPKTVVATPDTLEGFEGPLVVKARLHWTPGVGDAPARLETGTFPRAAAAADRASSIRELGGQPLLQEVVHGRLMAYTSVRDERGRTVAEVQQVAGRIWPTGTGVSVRAHTVEIDRSLAAAVSALLDDLGWFGIAEAQFILPERGGPRFIDFNGRLYGSLALALAAGPNLPAVWATLATGRAPGDVPAAAVGVRYHWLEGDLRRAAAERRGGLVRDVMECLLYARTATHSIWHRRDPKPAVRYGMRLLTGIRKRAVRASVAVA